MLIQLLAKQSRLRVLSVSFLLFALCTHAETLVVNSGQTITFNTTANTWSISGGASGSGTLSSGVATIATTNWNYEIAKFTFDSIDFQSGSTVTLTGTNALWLHSANSFTINTVLSTPGTASRTGVLGGYDGGLKDKSLDPAGAGKGPGGAPAASATNDSGPGGGHGGIGGRSRMNAKSGSIYNDTTLSFGLLGGSGGAGGGSANNGDSDGGAGGGAIRLTARTTLSIGATGQVRVPGRIGGSIVRCGGGGSGGTLELNANTIVIDSSSVVSAVGGAGGSATSPGGGGGGGRILFRANTLTVNGIVQTVGSLASSDQVTAAGGLKGVGADLAADGAAGSIYYVLPPPPPGTVISFQ